MASTTTVTATPSTASPGQPVTLDATVTCDGDPSGGLGMTFFDGANLLTTVPVAADGTASFTTSFTTTGAHPITAAYSGNGNCDASNGTTTVEVTTAPPPPGLCLLACDSIISINVDNSDNIYNIFDVNDVHNTYNVNHVHNTYNIFHGAGAHEPWKPGNGSGRNSR